jgi:hypothetical protein
MRQVVSKLVELGRVPDPLPGRASHFLGRGREAARQIGEELARAGGHKALRAALEATRSQMGSTATAELATVWEGISGWRGREEAAHFTGSVTWARHPHLG